MMYLVYKLRMQPISSPAKEGDDSQLSTHKLARGLKERKNTSGEKNQGEMELVLFTSQSSSSLFFTKTFSTKQNKTTNTLSLSLSSKHTNPLFYTTNPQAHHLLLSSPSRSSLSDSPDPEPSPRITDEWGDPLDDPETEPEPGYPSSSDADPPRDEDEWEEEKFGYVAAGNGVGTTSTAVEEKAAVEEEGGGVNIGELKRCLVDSVYGTELGFRASPETRAEVLELVNQLEAVNPTPSPVDATSSLDGTWVLL